MILCLNEERTYDTRIDAGSQDAAPLSRCAFVLALDWAEQGLKAFSQRADPRLRQFVAEEYHRRKRPDETMALIWAEFMDSTHLERYQNLKSHADRIGQWSV
ncbi:MAG TPA: hypothetical protein VGK99_22005 [Acidobacteriota bacterium]|jgi:hypothetical protein